MFGTFSSFPGRIRRSGNIFPPFVAHSASVWPVQRTATSEAGYKLAKRALDITGSLIGLLLLFPLLLIIAALVRLDSRGPVFHRRRVVARQDYDSTGEPETFDAFKFRTMRVDADEYLRERPELWEEYQKDYKLHNDPRVTRLGGWLRRTSIDELPQLVNVLLGQMSLVGPRILTKEELCRYGEHRAALLSVTPGLTGLWQVSGRQSVSYEERIRLDMAYLEGRSFYLDVEILLRTVESVISGRGAC